MVTTIPPSGLTATHMAAILGNLSRYLPMLLFHYGYIGLFLLMTLEGASFPIPSEVLLPAAGFLAARGYFDFGIALFVSLAGGIVGMAIDYYIAYKIGRGFVYKHVHTLHITKRRLEEFEAWFNKEGNFTVFIARLVPVVRGLINFPAGFAEMPVGKFFFFSFAGTLLWDSLLMLFGYFALTKDSGLITYVAIFVIILFVIYQLFINRLKKSGQQDKIKK